MSPRVFVFEIPWDRRLHSLSSCFSKIIRWIYLFTEKLQIVGSKSLLHCLHNRRFQSPFSSSLPVAVSSNLPVLHKQARRKNPRSRYWLVDIDDFKQSIPTQDDLQHSGTEFESRDCCWIETCEALSHTSHSSMSWHLSASCRWLVLPTYKA